MLAVDPVIVEPDAIVVPVETRRVSGAIVSTMRVTVPVDAFPARSVIVRVGLDPMLFPVPVHVTMPPVDGEGVQVVPGIEIVAPDSMSPVVMVISHPLLGFGEAVVDGMRGRVVSTVRLHVLEAKFWFPARSVITESGRVMLTSPSEIAVRVKMVFVLSITLIPDMVAFTGTSFPESQPESASLVVMRSENTVWEVWFDTEPESDITAVGRSVSMIYACVLVPVKPPLLAVTSRVPEVDIDPLVHVTGANAGSVPQLNPLFPAPENAIAVIVSPLELTTWIVVSVIGLFVRVVGAMIFTTGG
jgi:hypothetical protein